MNTLFKSNYSAEAQGGKGWHHTQSVGKKSQWQGEGVGKQGRGPSVLGPVAHCGDSGFYSEI